MTPVVRSITRMRSDSVSEKYSFEPTMRRPPEGSGFEPASKFSIASVARPPSPPVPRIPLPAMVVITPAASIRRMRKFC